MKKEKKNMCQQNFVVNFKDPLWNLVFANENRLFIDKVTKSNNISIKLINPAPDSDIQ